MAGKVESRCDITCHDNFCETASLFASTKRSALTLGKQKSIQIADMYKVTLHILHIGEFLSIDGLFV
jgi:hypothetical protein